VSALILVVDDEPEAGGLFRQQFRRELRALHLVMEFVQSPPEALQRVGAAEAARLVISDVNIPGMSGIELLRGARRARPDLPVMMITAYGDLETRRLAIKVGAAWLFTKPIDYPELQGEIGRRLEAAAGPQ
jgi:CheY-like chemotaxis protein